MLIERAYDLSSLLRWDRVLLIYGPRRAGKTTLLQSFLERCDLKYKMVTGESVRIHEVLGSLDLSKIMDFIFFLL